MSNGSNCDRKPQLSGILTEPLNPRVLCRFILFLLDNDLTLTKMKESRNSLKFIVIAVDIQIK